ncbi:MAG: BACON domain-containing protein [Acidobacteriota bacterium]
MVVLAVMGCSDGGHRSANNPNAPSPVSVAASEAGATGASGAFVSTVPPDLSFVPQDVTFPPRNEPFAFRRDVLEPKYRDQLRRPLQNSFVDIEGTIVWTQEYLRYRVNRCDHLDAVSRVFSQIDGRGIMPVCAEVTGTPIFPPRNEPFDFRTRLETKYRDELRRPATQTAVDIEGDIVWTQEYLRYRVSSCSHLEAVDKVIAQIDGRGVQPDCTPVVIITCSYSMSPTFQSVAAGGGTFGASLSTGPTCTWQLSSNVPWVSASTGGGTGSTGFSFSVAANTAQTARTGRLTLTAPTGFATLDVSQAGVAAPPPPPPCNYAVSPTSQNIISGGGNFSVSITTAAGCAWSASSLSSFLSITSGSSGSGNGTVNINVGSNTGAARTGTVRISYTGGSQDVTVSQSSGIPPPVAVIRNPSSCAVNTTCAFDGTSSQGTITQWEWDFGDGTTGSGPMVNKTYPTSFVPQTFSSRTASVRLTVTGPGGTSTATSTVTVTRTY